MKGRIGWFVVALLLPAAIGPGIPGATAAEAEECPPHPHPCGDEWPAGLEGPFQLREVLHVQVPSHDGVRLEGWVGIPDLPEGATAPVVLHSTPYLGVCYPPGTCQGTPGSALWWRRYEPEQSGLGYRTWRVLPVDLVERGYAAAYFSVRGTGRSEGCLDHLGDDERRDQLALVEWLATQPWSNGRVAMGGVSYPGATPWLAAVDAPAPLKTIVVAGTITDLYTVEHSPQGAQATEELYFNTQFWAGVSGTPPLGAVHPLQMPDSWEEGFDEFLRGAQETVTALPGNTVQRLCDASVQTTTGAGQAFVTEDRNEPWYRERNQTGRLDEVTAAVLLAQGFGEGPAHAFQDRDVWAGLTRAPRRQLVGQWGHTFPAGVTYPQSWSTATWSELLFSWLDYWLKGIGEPERLGTVDYQADDGAWRESTAWPPTEAHEEVLHLTDHTLAPEPSEVDRTFRSAPSLANAYPAASHEGVPVQPWAALCGTAVAAGPDAPGLAYVGDVLPQAARLAGNPYVHLHLSADQPGGLVVVHLLELTSSFACDPAGQPTGLELIAYGAADLRFHTGNFTARDFPTDTPTPVHVDLIDTAAAVSAGSRLALLVSHGGTVHEPMTRAWTPRITVHGDGDLGPSHLVVPVVEGATGGVPLTSDHESRDGTLASTMPPPLPPQAGATLPTTGAGSGLIALVLLLGWSTVSAASVGRHATTVAPR